MKLEMSGAMRTMQIDCSYDGKVFSFQLEENYTESQLDSVNVEGGGGMRGLP